VWVSDVERSDDSNQAVPWRPPLSLILVSVLAVGVAVVHVEESVQKVEDLSDQVQRIAFSGAVDAGTRTELETAMSGFFTHLRQAGLPLPSTEPHVEVVDKGRVTPVYYSARTGKIMVARKLTGDLGRVLWSYGDYLCSTLWRVRTVLGADTADKLLIQSWKAVAKEPVLAASASFASTVLELTEQQRGPAAATQVQEVFRKRGLVLG